MGTAYDAPLYLVTNMADAAAAMTLYRQRAHIETFFSDQKAGGFRSTAAMCAIRSG